MKRWMLAIVIASVGSVAMGDEPVCSGSVCSLPQKPVRTMVQKVASPVVAGVRQRSKTVVRVFQRLRCR